MTDEKYIFKETERERKRTARGAYNKCSGKNCRRVKTPSDYLTRKERDKMNGEVKSYRLNEPMTLAEFKQMPDDLQRRYIEGIIRNYDPTFKAIAAAMSVGYDIFWKAMHSLGIKSKRGGTYKTDRNDAFFTWWYGVDKLPKVSDAPVEDTAKVEEPVIERVEELPGRKIAPVKGNIELYGTPAEIGETIASFLGDSRIICRVEWEVEL